MRPKYSTVIALFCAIVYLLAVGVATNRILAGINERMRIAEREFQDLVDRASAAAVLGFMDQPFLEAVRDGINESRTLRALIISGPYGSEYAVERQSGYLTWTDDNPRFIERFGITKDPFFAPLRIDGVRNATIRAVSEYIDPGTIGNVLRYALFAVIAALGLSLLTLVLESGTRKAQRDPPPPNRVPPRTEEEGYEPFEIPTLDPGVTDGPADGREDPERTPTGLYSPRSNISWESYTFDRLASELHRSASFEQDLVYLVMELDAGDNSATAYAEFAAAAASFFTFRDLIFERGETGISVILPNVDLDHGFRMAEEFRAKLLNRTSLQILSGTELRIGLSSRSGRLVDADRLMLEAERAIAKAISDGSSPIVAFKSDPERYRAFIATH